MLLAARTQFLCGAKTSGVQVRFGWVMAFELSPKTLACCYNTPLAVILYSNYDLCVLAKKKKVGRTASICASCTSFV